MPGGKEFSDCYTIGGLVSPASTGSAGAVFLCTRNQDGASFAVKRIVKSIDCLEGTQQVEVMKCLNHENIVKLIDWFDSDQTLYIVMELAKGGDMCDRIMQVKQLPERQAAIAFRQILMAVCHVHDKGLIHGDIKPENILYESFESDDIKLADFGFAQFVEAGQLKWCGTKSYSAPEILEDRKYDYKADMWSLGALLYTMLGGGPPFGNPSADEFGRAPLKMRKNDINLNYKVFQKVSPEAKDLIKQLLVYNPSQRLSAAEALQHPWMACKEPDLTYEINLSIG